jgi:peptidoglycan/LPS O-acetylase OafA/YrhL
MSLPRNNSGRLHHLDALRGIAALSVAVVHGLEVFLTNEFLVLMGRPAVTFFFLLSGYVLGKSLAKTEGHVLADAAGYCVRRVFRLYPAIFVTLVIASVLAKFYVVPGPSSEATEWFRLCLFKATTISSLYDYIGSFRLYYLRLDPPLWSLQVEFVCSFLLPLLVWPTRRFRVARMLMLGALAWLKIVRPGILLGMTVYLFEFYLGYLAWSFTASVSKIGPKKTMWLIVLSFFGTLWWMFFWDRGGVGFVSIFGMAVFLALLGPCKWERIKSILQTPVLQFLGRISYSLYLIHFPILLICFSVGWGRMNPGWGGSQAALAILLMMLPISMILAVGIDRFVERPFNRLGHVLSNLLGNAIRSLSGKTATPG